MPKQESSNIKPYNILSALKTPRVDPKNNAELDLNLLKIPTGKEVDKILNGKDRTHHSPRAEEYEDLLKNKQLPKLLQTYRTTTIDPQKGDFKERTISPTNPLTRSQITHTILSVATAGSWFFGRQMWLLIQQYQLNRAVKQLAAAHIKRKLVQAGHADKQAKTNKSSNSKGLPPKGNRTKQLEIYDQKLEKLESSFRTRIDKLQSLGYRLASTGLGLIASMSIWQTPGLLPNLLPVQAHAEAGIRNSKIFPRIDKPIKAIAAPLTNLRDWFKKVINNGQAIDQPVWPPYTSDSRSPLSGSSVASYEIYGLKQSPMAIFFATGSSRVKFNLMTGPVDTRFGTIMPNWKEIRIAQTLKSPPKLEFTDKDGIPTKTIERAFDSISQLKVDPTLTLPLEVKESYVFPTLHTQKGKTRRWLAVPLDKITWSPSRIVIHPGFKPHLDIKKGWEELPHHKSAVGIRIKPGHKHFKAILELISKSTSEGPQTTRVDQFIKIPNGLLESKIALSSDSPPKYWVSAKSCPPEALGSATLLGISPKIKCVYLPAAGEVFTQREEAQKHAKKIHGDSYFNPNILTPGSALIEENVSGISHLNRSFIETDRSPSRVDIIIEPNGLSYKGLKERLKEQAEKKGQVLFIAELNKGRFVIPPMPLTSLDITNPPTLKLHVIPKKTGKLSKECLSAIKLVQANQTTGEYYLFTPPKVLTECQLAFSYTFNKQFNKHSHSPKINVTETTEDHFPLLGYVPSHYTHPAFSNESDKKQINPLFTSLPKELRQKVINWRHRVNNTYEEKDIIKVLDEIRGEIVNNSWYGESRFIDWKLSQTKKTPAEVDKILFANLKKGRGLWSQPISCYTANYMYTRLLWAVGLRSQVVTGYQSTDGILTNDERHAVTMVSYPTPRARFPFKTAIFDATPPTLENTQSPNNMWGVAAGVFGAFAAANLASNLFGKKTNPGEENNTSRSPKIRREENKIRNLIGDLSTVELVIVNRVLSNSTTYANDSTNLVRDLDQILAYSDNPKTKNNSPNPRAVKAAVAKGQMETLFSWVEDKAKARDNLANLTIKNPRLAFVRLSGFCNILGNILVSCDPHYENTTLLTLEKKAKELRASLEKVNKIQNR